MGYNSDENPLLSFTWTFPLRLVLFIVTYGESISESQLVDSADPCTITSDYFFVGSSPRARGRRATLTAISTVRLPSQLPRV